MTKQIFPNYQLPIVGALTEVMPLAESDDEGCEEAVNEGRAAMACTQREVTAPLQPQEENSTADDVWHQPLPMHVGPSAHLTDGNMYCDHFILTSVAKLNKLYHASTYLMPQEHRESLTSSEEVSWRAVFVERVLGCLATMLHQSLQRYYLGVGGDKQICEDIDVTALMNKHIVYPTGSVAQLGDLVMSQDACHAFLKKLYGNEGTPFLCHYFYREEQSIQKNLRACMLDLILPYALVMPLILSAVVVRDRRDLGL